MHRHTILRLSMSDLQGINISRADPIRGSSSKQWPSGVSIGLKRWSEKPLFSIDWILSYMARLLIVEQWNELDSAKGKIILEAFVG
jgi:hypothetical protein